eukprot:5398499-Amphidinium_carterae.3
MTVYTRMNATLWIASMAFSPSWKDCCLLRSCAAEWLVTWNDMCQWTMKVERQSRCVPLQHTETEGTLDGQDCGCDGPEKQLRCLGIPLLCGKDRVVGPHRKSGIREEAMAIVKQKFLQIEKGILLVDCMPCSNHCDPADGVGSRPWSVMRAVHTLRWSSEASSRRTDDDARADLLEGLSHITSKSMDGPTHTLGFYKL